MLHPLHRCATNTAMDFKPLTRTLIIFAFIEIIEPDAWQELKPNDFMLKHKRLELRKQLSWQTTQATRLTLIPVPCAGCSIHKRLSE